jgi:5-methylcytosine-specific restriction endonuclease McrA
MQTRFVMNSIVHLPERPQPQPQPQTPQPRKQKISAALREQVWIQRHGRLFETKCMTTWCHNTITVFNFQCGHDIPESKGGPTNLENLYPICVKCNLSMSNKYTFKEWCKLHTTQKVYPETPELPQLKPNPFWRKCLICFTST